MNLYRLARTVNTIQAIAKPRRLPRRLKNIVIGRLFARAGWWSKLWGGTMKIRQRLEMIRADCVADAARYDGLPFNGRTLAPILGEHLAMIDALAASMLELEQRLDPRLKAQP